MKALLLLISLLNTTPTLSHVHDTIILETRDTNTYHCGDVASALSAHPGEYEEITVYPNSCTTKER